jgi:hypothetical protein
MFFAIAFDLMKSPNRLVLLKRQSREIVTPDLFVKDGTWITVSIDQTSIRTKANVVVFGLTKL